MILDHEYVIECQDASSRRNDYTYYLFTQSDSKPHWMDIRLFYHQTLLSEIGGSSLDGGRYFTTCPQSDGLEILGSGQWDVRFRYMERDLFLYKLNEFFYQHEWTNEAEISRNNLFNVVLLFENKRARKAFKEYAVKEWDNRDY